jgi:hypothetical protein
MSDLEHAGVLSRLHLEKKVPGLESTVSGAFQTAPGKEGFKSLEGTISGAFQSSLGKKDSAEYKY